MSITKPEDLPPYYRELYEERGALIQEGCRLGTDREGTAEANRRAFSDVLRVMSREQAICLPDPDET